MKTALEVQKGKKIAPAARWSHKKVPKHVFMFSIKFAGKSDKNSTPRENQIKNTGRGPTTVGVWNILFYQATVDTELGLWITTKTWRGSQTKVKARCPAPALRELTPTLVQFMVFFLFVLAKRVWVQALSKLPSLFRSRKDQNQWLSQMLTLYECLLLACCSVK